MIQRICLLLITLTVAFCCRAQDTVINDFAIVKLPKQARRITKEEALLKVRPSQLNDPKSVRGVLNLFDIDGVIAVLREDTVNIADYTLEEQKRQTDALFRSSDYTRTFSIQSKIVIENGVRFYLHQTISGTISFISDIKEHKWFVCKLVYQPKDKSKAQRIFKRLLKSFTYKNHPQ